MKKSSLALIIPAYNEDQVIRQTLQQIRSALKSTPITIKLIVINDGSGDQTAKIAKKYADVVLNHRLNRGLGAALATGIEYVKRKKSFDYLITFDSDGQHNPKDILRALKKLQSGYDVVIGSRFLNKAQSFPKLRKYILKLSNLVTFLFFQIKTTDSQSGFRAFSQKAFNQIELHTNRMEVSSEFFAEIKRHQLQYIEIPIQVKYTPYSMQKGQSNLNSLAILIKLIYKVLR